MWMPPTGWKCSDGKFIPVKKAVLNEIFCSNLSVTMAFYFDSNVEKKHFSDVKTSFFQFLRQRHLNFSFWNNFIFNIF